MLDKLLFNNLLVSNKKNIQRGRVQTINKLVQKVQKLKTLLEKTPSNEKYKERLRITIESIANIKKLKHTDIIKNILVLKKSAIAIITNGLSMPEEISIALLSMNKIIAGLVSDFKQKLSLNDDNPNWMDEVTEISKRQAKRDRTEMRKKKRAERKSSNVLARKRSEWVKENVETNDDNPEDKLDVEENIEEGDVILASKVNKPNKSSNVLARKRSEWVKENVETNDDNPEDKLEVEENIEEGDVLLASKVNKPKSKNKTKTLKRSARNCDKKCEKDDKVKLERPDSEDRKLDGEKSSNDIGGEIELVKTIDEGDDLLASKVNKSKSLKRGTNNNLTDSENELHATLLKSPKKPKEPIITQVIDTFFFTSSGDYYKSMVVLDRVHNPNLDKLNKPNDDDQKKLVSNKSNDQNERNRRGYQVGELHPSMVAKQNMKPKILPFQGKKVIFDEKDNSQTVPMIQAKSLQTNAVSQASNLHPSWVAKQKLKPKIVDFQGKKITFDDN